MRRRGVLRALALAVLCAPVRARAHAALVRSTPAHRAVLSTPPERVELWFSERLEPDYARLSVWSAAGTRVDLGDAAVGADRTRLAVSLPLLGPGTYTVRFRVLSVDGHVVESSLVFTIRSASRAP